MDLKRVITFITISETGSVTKAAARLRITQPALSRQIAQLQRDLGVRLVERLGRRIILTPEGEQLLADFRDLVGRAKAIEERAKAMSERGSGILLLAASALGTEAAFAQLLHFYKKIFPNVQIRMCEAIGSEMLQMLGKGEIHFGVCLLRSVQEDGRDFGFRLLQPVHLLAACAVSYPLKIGGSLDVRELASHPLLLLDRGFSARKSFDLACRRAEVTPEVMFESSAPSNILALAEAGHGVAVLSSLVRTERYNVRLASVTRDGEVLEEPLVVVYNQRRNMPAFAQVFLDMITQQMSRYFDYDRVLNQE